MKRTVSLYERNGEKCLYLQWGFKGKRTTKIVVSPELVTGDTIEFPVRARLEEVGDGNFVLVPDNGQTIYLLSLTEEDYGWAHIQSLDCGIILLGDQHLNGNYNPLGTKDFVHGVLIGVPAGNLATFTARRMGRGMTPFLWKGVLTEREEN